MATVKVDTCRIRSKASRPIISAGGGSTLCALFDASSFSKNCSFVGVCITMPRVKLRGAGASCGRQT